MQFMLSCFQSSLMSQVIFVFVRFSKVGCFYSVEGVRNVSEGGREYGKEVGREGGREGFQKCECTVKGACVCEGGRKD